MFGLKSRKNSIDDIMQINEEAEKSIEENEDLRSSAQKNGIQITKLNHGLGQVFQF